MGGKMIIGYFLAGITSIILFIVLNIYISRKFPIQLKILKYYITYVLGGFIVLGLVAFLVVGLFEKSLWWIPLMVLVALSIMFLTFHFVIYGIEKLNEALEQKKKLRT